MTAIPRKSAIERVERPDRQWIGDVGFYAVRLTKGGAEVGCEVSYGPSCDPETGEPLDRSWLWVVTINGQVTHCSPMKPAAGFRIGRRISEAEFNYLLDRAQWAVTYEPSSPEANPRQAFDLTERPIPFLEA